MAKINFFKTAIATAVCSMLFAACGDDSSSSPKTENSVESSTSEDDDSSTSKNEIVSISDKAISGVSQKGPFVTGSSVKVFELDENFKQTGKSFTGKIEKDDGAFAIESVELASQYAVLEASGYYRNEVTGEKSAGTITLNAITDLSDREKVNVNLLTHLEYDRAMYLVKHDTMSVVEAKAQAENEIFKAIGIEGDFGNSEDLDIFSKGEGNAALLAISVLMQGDKSEAELTEFLTKFAGDIKEDGTWDDEAAKVELADWALLAETSGKLDSISQNVASWKLGEVPEFKPLINTFWVRVYGLDVCSKEVEGKVVSNPNSKSKLNPDTRFICKAGEWAEASDLEKDTYGWDPGIVGKLHAKEGRFTKTWYVYDFKTKEWRLPKDMEIDTDDHRSVPVGEVQSFHRICTELSEGQPLLVLYEQKFNSDYCTIDDVSGDTIAYNWENGTYEVPSYNFPCEARAFICKDLEWVEVDVIEASLDTLNARLKSVQTESYDGDGFLTSLNQWYKYDAKLGWTFANKLDVAIKSKLGSENNEVAGCTEKKAGDVLSVDDYYVLCVGAQGFTCSAGKCVYTEIYYHWESDYEESMFGKKCSEGNVGEETELEQQVYIEGTDHEVRTIVYKYVCTSDGWEKKE